MDSQIPYMHSASKLRQLLDKIREAGEPEKFTQRFLLDLGFKSRFDRPFIGVLKYLGMLDTSGRPTDSYSRFRSGTETQAVLRACVETAYDDLFMANPSAAGQSKAELTGWFKTKSGKAEATATLMAATFKTLCDYAGSDSSLGPVAAAPAASPDSAAARVTSVPAVGAASQHPLSLHIEVRLDGQPGTDYGAFFGALKEHLLSE